MQWHGQHGRRDYEVMAYVVDSDIYCPECAMGGCPDSAVRWEQTDPIFAGEEWYSLDTLRPQELICAECGDIIDEHTEVVM